MRGASSYTIAASNLSHDLGLVPSVLAGAAAFLLASLLTSRRSASGCASSGR